MTVFGDSIGEEGLGNLQVLRKVITISGKYADYVKEIQASHKLGYPAYQIASEGSSTLIFMYENRIFCLGTHNQHIYKLTLKAVTKMHYLAYWKEGSSSSSNALHRLKVIEEFEVNVVLRVKLDPYVHTVRVRGDISPSGGAGVQGDGGGVVPSGLKGERGVAGVQGKR